MKTLFVVLLNVDTKETLERWEFNVDYETENDENADNNATKFKDSSTKDEKKIQQEMRDVIRQITASVTFLPLIDCLCSFDILIHTHKSVWLFLGVFVL